MFQKLNSSIHLGTGEACRTTSFGSSCRWLSGKISKSNIHQPWSKPWRRKAQLLLHRRCPCHLDGISTGLASAQHASSENFYGKIRQNMVWNPNCYKTALQYKKPLWTNDMWLYCNWLYIYHDLFWICSKGPCHQLPPDRLLVPQLLHAAEEMLPSYCSSDDICLDQFLMVKKMTQQNSLTRLTFKCQLPPIPFSFSQAAPFFTQCRPRFCPLLFLWPLWPLLWPPRLPARVSAKPVPVHDLWRSIMVLDGPKYYSSPLGRKIETVCARYSIPPHTSSCLFLSQWFCEHLTWLLSGSDFLETSNIGN